MGENLKKPIMHNELIKTHLRTSNIYVIRQIVRDNLARLQNYQSTFHVSDIKKKPYKDLVRAIERQQVIKLKLTKTINDLEQQSFPFGGFASPY